MTSMQLRPHPLPERHPLAGQRHQLRRLRRMFLGNVFKDGDFLVDHPHHVFWLATGANGYPPGQHAAGVDDALVGFGWGHGRKP